MKTRGVLLLSLGLLGHPSATAGVVATDLSIPRLMEAGGSDVDPAQYILGENGPVTLGYNATGPDGHLRVGSSSSFNELTVRNGSTLSAGAAWVGGQFLFGSYPATPQADGNRMIVTGAGSSATFPGGLLIGGKQSDNEVIVSSGGALHVGSSEFVLDEIHIGNDSGSTGNLLHVTGAGSQLTHLGSQIHVAGEQNNRLVIDGGATASLPTLYVNGVQVINQPDSGSDNSVLVSGTGSQASIGYAYIGNNHESNFSLTAADGAQLTILYGLEVGYSNYESAGNLFHIDNAGATIGGTVYVGRLGHNERMLVENGGTAQLTGDLWVGNSGASRCTAHVRGSGSELSVDGTIDIGQSATGSLLAIDSGATVSSGSGLIGSTYLANRADLRGSGSVWTARDLLQIGGPNPGNMLTIADHALVIAGGNLAVDPAATDGNFIRLDGGMLAWQGDHLAAAAALAAAGKIRKFEAGSWVADPSVAIAHHADESAALAATGYSGLAGHTIIGSPAAGTVILGPELGVVYSPTTGEVVDGQVATVDFPVNNTGAAPIGGFFLENHGPEPLVVSAISLPADFTTTLATPFTIPGRGVQPLSITCTGAAGLHQGTVTLASNDTDEAAFDFTIRAHVNPPDISVSQSFNPFIEVQSGDTSDLGELLLGETRDFSFTIRNLNPGTLNVSSLTLPAGCALSPFSSAPPFSLGKNQTRTVTLRFNGSAPGPAGGDFVIHSNDFDEPAFTLHLELDVSPESIRFFGFSSGMSEGGFLSASAFGSGSVTYEWDLDGDGQFDDATGSFISVPESDGPSDLPVSVRMTDDLTTMVRSESIPVENVEPELPLDFSFDTVAGSAFVLPLAATDVAADLAAGFTWSVDWGDGTNESTAPGHAADPTFSHTYAAPGQAHTLTVQVTDKDGGTATRQAELWVHSNLVGVFDGPDTASPQLRDGQGELAFTTSLGQPVERPITLLNRGSSATTIGPVTVPAGFEIVSPVSLPATLAAGGELSLTVRFPGTAYGTTQGTLSIQTEDPLMPLFDIALTGEVAAPDIVVNFYPMEIYDLRSGFGLLEISAFGGSSLTIESSDGSVPLTIDSIDLPAGFQFGSGAPEFPVTLSYETTTSLGIPIECTATAPGVHDGWLVIHSNDPDESAFRTFLTSRVSGGPDLMVVTAEGFPLLDTGSTADNSAAGVMPDGSPEPLVFAARAATGSPTPRGLVLANGGDQALTISAIDVPAGFAFQTEPAFPLVIPAFGSQALPDLLFNAASTSAGILSISSDDADENPYQISLGGEITGAAAVLPRIGNLVITPGAAGSPSSISATLSGGAPLSTVLVQASADLGVLDPWRTIGSVTLDAAGAGSIDALTDPPATSGTRHFFRLKEE